VAAPIDGVALPGMVFVGALVVPAGPLAVPPDGAPLPCPVVLVVSELFCGVVPIPPRPLGAAVGLVGEPGGLPICAPVFAPGACGLQGLRGVARCPVGVPGDVGDRCCWAVGVLLVVEPVLCATAGPASAAASAAPLNEVRSAFRVISGPLDFGYPRSLQGGGRDREHHECMVGPVTRRTRHV